jgi:hypothetical protein
MKDLVICNRLFCPQFRPLTDCEIILYCYASLIPIKKFIKNYLNRQQIIKRKSSFVLGLSISVLPIYCPSICASPVPPST